MLLTGLESEKENLSAIWFNCLKIQEFFCSPIGAIAPFVIDIFLFGIILTKFI